MAVTNAQKKKGKRIERAQLGYQMKHLRSAAFHQLPAHLKTPGLRKAMYDLTHLDQLQAVLTPTLEGPKPINNNIVRTIYHDGPDVRYTQEKFHSLTQHMNKTLHKSLIQMENRYKDLTAAIRREQMPQVPSFPRPIPSRQHSEINDQFKMDPENPEHRQQIAQQYADLPHKGRLHVDKLSKLYSKLAYAQRQGNEADINAITEQINNIPFNSAEFSALLLPQDIKPATVLTSRVFNMCAHPIDFLDLYRAVFRGKQPIMSQKLMKEIDIMQYAVDNLTDAEFALVNPHRAAIMTWKLMNSDDLDEATVTTALRYLDRMGDHNDRTQIHHNPEIMADSWIVEAFNNRNNPNYSLELLKGAKAADSDLNRFKLFLHDTELVPRRLAVFLGLHYVKTKRTLPPYAIQPFFHALNYCRYPGQINTLLNVIVTAAPDLVVPPEGIYEAMIAAHKIGEINSIEQLSSYIRSSTGLGRSRVLPMNYRVGSIYIDALQTRANTELKQLDMNIRSETTAVLKDMITRGQVPDVFSHDMIDAFLIPEHDPEHGNGPIDILPLIGGNTDPRFASSSPSNIHEKSANFAQLRVKQHQQDTKLSPKLKTFNINVQSHVLPTVAFTAINYALRSLHEMGNKQGLVFRKPVRLYIANMKSLYEDFNAQLIAPDRNNNAGSIDQINQDLDGNPLRPVDKKTGQQVPFGMTDMASLPHDAGNNILMPNPESDLNAEFRNLSRVLDASDIFTNMADEKASPINPHVAHLVEQCIPSLAYNPHIYDDVLDIIHIKTGLSPRGEETIGAGSGLRSPDKIDEFLARQVEQFLQAFGLVATKNARFGYYEFSVDEMNRFLTRDPDSMLASYTVATEKMLQAEELNKKLRKEAKAIDDERTGINMNESDDEIGLRADLIETDINKSILRNQMLRDRKYNTPSGKPLDDKTLLYQDLLGQQDVASAKRQYTKLELLRHGVDVTEIPTPASLNPHMVKVPFASPKDERAQADHTAAVNM